MKMTLRIAFWFLGMPLVSIAQKNFADSLRYNEFSDIVFIDYDIIKKELTVKSSSRDKSIYSKNIEKALTDDKSIAVFVRRSAKTSFILPVYFWVDHDEKDWKWDMDAVLVSKYGIEYLLAILKDIGNGSRQILDPISFSSNFGGRKE